MMLPVRIRLDSGWADARIRNVSSRGVLLQLDNPPPKGSYIEIRRRDVVIIGQVRWLGQDCCGLRTQDKVPIEHLKANKDGPVSANGNAQAFVDRRATARVMSPQEAAEQNRIKALVFQRMMLIAAGAGGAILLASLMFDALQKPFAVIAQTLG